MSKKPCKHCPFRSDVYFGALTEEKAEAILEALLGDGYFHCHQTIDYGDKFEGKITNDSRLCIGAAIFLENVREDGGIRANLSFRLAVWSGEIVIDQLSKEVAVYESIEAFRRGVCEFRVSTRRKRPLIRKR